MFIDFRLENSGDGLIRPDRVAISLRQGVFRLERRFGLLDAGSRVFAGLDHRLFPLVETGGK
jgi:hypothetical protein